MQLNSNRNVAAVSHLSLDPISEEASRSDTTCASEFQDSPMLNYMQLPVPLLEMQPEEEPKEIASQTEIVDGAINQTGLRKKSTPRLCVVLDCTSQARYNERCKRHGGSKPCIVPGCTKTTQTHGLCIRHGGGSRCSYPNCQKATQSKGLCKCHGGGRCCSAKGCQKKVHLKRLCRQHGGGVRCQFSGCSKWSQRSGYCMAHYKNAQSTT